MGEVKKKKKKKENTGENYQERRKFTTDYQ